jgi:hypothetical protein
MLQSSTDLPPYIQSFDTPQKTPFTLTRSQPQLSQLYKAQKLIKPAENAYECNIVVFDDENAKKPTTIELQA